MKKPFKLKAYYVVKLGAIDESAHLDELGLQYKGKAVIHINPEELSVRDDPVHGKSVYADYLDCWVFYDSERKYCKRCDNAFVLGVTYIDSNGEEFICTTDTEGRYVLHDVSNPDNYYWCQDNDPKQFTPKVGMIN